VLAEPFHVADQMIRRVVAQVRGGIAGVRGAA
jgi:hypothetical protein